MTLSLCFPLSHANIGTDYVSTMIYTCNYPAVELVWQSGIIQTDVFCFVHYRVCLLLNMWVIKVLQGRSTANKSLKQRLQREVTHRAFYTGGDALVTTRWHSDFTPLTFAQSHIHTRTRWFSLTSRQTYCRAAKRGWKKNSKVRRENRKIWIQKVNRQRVKKKKNKVRRERKKYKLTHKQWSNCSHHFWLLGDLCCHGMWCGRCHGLGLTLSSVFHCC